MDFSIRTKKDRSEHNVTRIIPTIGGIRLEAGDGVDVTIDERILADVMEAVLERNQHFENAGEAYGSTVEGIIPFPEGCESYIPEPTPVMLKHFCLLDSEGQVLQTMPDRGGDTPEILDFIRAEGIDGPEAETLADIYGERGFTIIRRHRCISNG